MMNYTRLYDLPQKKSHVVMFEDAKDGAAYRDNHDGSIRVKIGEIYLRFTQKGIVEGYLSMYWPVNTLSCDEVYVDLGLYLKVK
jgi:hypothetical protein